MPLNTMVWFALRGRRRRRSVRKPRPGCFFACWAIVIVLSLMVLVFLRARKKEYAVAILPLLIAPFVHISAAFSPKDGYVPFLCPPDKPDYDRFDGGADFLPAAGAGLPGIPDRRTRNGLFWCCAGFVVILTLVLVTNTLTAIVHG